MARSEIVWRILTLHCDEASRLSSESLDHPLPRVDRLACRLHLLICARCRRHRRDILALRRYAGQASLPVDRPRVALPDDVREQIKKSLKEDNRSL
jgi:hypothetical protein